MPLRATYHPRGFPLRLTTNSPAVLEAAVESWGRFALNFPVPPLRLRVGVRERSGDACPPPPVMRGFGPQLAQIADAENFAVADLRRGRAFVWLTEAAAAERGYLRYHFLEGLAACLLEALHLTSVHAALVGRDAGRGERALLLAGRSRAGKSSLAYACARAGWTFYADDCACLVRGREEELALGNSGQMRFRADAPNLFPELAGARLTPKLSGEMAIELATSARPDLRLGMAARVTDIIFLNRATFSQAGWARVEPADALARLAETVCWGESRARAAQRASLRRLVAAAPALELRYTTLEEAVASLEELVAAAPGGRAAGPTAGASALSTAGAGALP